MARVVFADVLKRHDGGDSPDLRPNPNAPVRNVKKIDKEFIGAAPGLDDITGPRDGADRNVKVQLPLLQ